MLTGPVHHHPLAMESHAILLRPMNTWQLLIHASKLLCRPACKTALPCCRHLRCPESAWHSTCSRLGLAASAKARVARKLAHDSALLPMLAAFIIRPAEAHPPSGLTQSAYKEGAPCMQA